MTRCECGRGIAFIELASGAYCCAFCAGDIASRFLKSTEVVTLSALSEAEFNRQQRAEGVREFWREARAQRA